MERDERLMRRALDEAGAAAGHADVPIGAVVVRGEDVVASAHNTVELTRDVTAHAEMNALRAAAVKLGSPKLHGCELYVTLEPCPMCAMAAVWYRIDRLVFGAWNPKCGAAGTLYNITDDPRLNHAVAVVRGVLADACAAPLSAFFEDLRTG